MVVIDCPPLLPVTDAAALSARVDATLLVVSAGTTTRKEASRAVELLNQVGAKTIGTVLNGMKAEPGYRYHYGYAPYRHDDATRVQNGGKRIRIGNVPEEASEAAVEQPTSEWTTGREGV